MFKNPKEMVMSVIAVGVIGTFCLAFLIPVIAPLFGQSGVPKVITGKDFAMVVTMIVTFYFSMKSIALAGNGAPPK